jgi:ABC-type nickel/cobalt efflux system permease component RcnA
MYFTRISIFALLIISFWTPVYAAESLGAQSLWMQLTVWLLEQQRDYHRELTTALKHLSKDGSWASAEALMLGSFFYGVFHAAGPGHGKAVMTSYLLSHGGNIRISLLMATLAAFCQGIVAILIIYGLIYLAGWLPRETSFAVQWSERLSFFLVAALGAWLMFRAVNIIYQSWCIGKNSHSTEHTLKHNHDYGTYIKSCNHDHLPSQEQVDAASDWRGFLGVVLSIGMRPCSGAILVLVFAKAFGIAWFGIGAVFAMAAGTAITVASIALLTIKARDTASSLLNRKVGNWVMVPTGIALLGGTFIMVLGIGLLSLSFGSAHPLRL